MKKTQRKDAFRNIRKRIVSFLSICLVIMLGLGGVFVIRYMRAGINAEATGYYNSHGFKTYELISSLGVTEDDIAQIKETEGVTDAEGVIRAAGSLTKGDFTCNVDLISMTERISVPEVLEGRAPEAKDECVIAEDFAETRGLKVGDKVRLIMEDIASPVASSEDGRDEDKADGKDGEKADEKGFGGVLLEDEFTVTGLIKHPDYLRRKSVEYVVLPWAAYDKSVTDGFYTHAFVKSDDPEGIDVFSDKYFEKTAGTKQALEELTDTLAVDSAQRAKEKAYARIDEEWQKALKELEDAQNEIDDNEATLNDELAKARRDLENAQKELDRKVGDYNKQIRNAEKLIKEGEQRIKNGEKQIKENEKKINDAEKQLNEYKKYFELAEKYLPDAEKYVNEKKAEYEEQLKGVLETIEEAKKLLSVLEKLDPDSEEFKETAIKLVNLLESKKDDVKKIQDALKTDKAIQAVQELLEFAPKIKEATGIDFTGLINAVSKFRDFDYDGFCTRARELAENADKLPEFIKKTEELLKSIQDELDTLKEYAEYIQKFKDNEGTIRSKIREKEQELEDGKNKLKKAKDDLAAGKRELAAAKKKLAAGKAELASEKKKYEAQIRDGWNLYYTKKADYESKLEEAKALLAENREAAEEKLAEARAEVEKIECKWLVFDRRANAGYVDIKSTLYALNSAGTIFGLLFMLISAIVCFSTLTIIIEEQKKMVGTVKAFGFRKREVLSKYLVFGVIAAIIGCIAGILLALGLSGLVLKAYHNTGMYQFGLAKSIVTIGPTILFCLIMIAICAVATVIACSDILKSPASILMKGGTAKKNSGYRKTTTSKRGGSLYSRLILRNMSDDKVRVAISIIIIAFSTLLVGVGISMKFGFDGMRTTQISDVYKYDVRVDLGDKVTGGDKLAMEEIMARDGAEYLSASYESHIFHLDDRLDALYVLTADPEALDEYFAVRDTKKGEILEMPEDGILVQKKIKESYGKDIGSTISILNSELDDCEAEVKGVFQNYVGRIVITTPEGYRSIFREDPVYNCYYVKTGGADMEKLQQDLLSVS